MPPRPQQRGNLPPQSQTYHPSLGNNPMQPPRPAPQPIPAISEETKRRMQMTRSSSGGNNPATSNAVVGAVQAFSSAGTVRADPSLNIYRAMHDYVTRMLSHDSGSMKALLLDHETTNMIAMVYSQSEILSKHVFLVENVEQLQGWIKQQLTVKQQNPDRQYGETIDTQTLHHLKAVCFLTPSKATLAALKVLFKTPRYREYYLFFNNMLPTGYLDALADIDEHDVVKQVHEYYGDFYAVTPTMFHFDNTLATATVKSPYSPSGYQLDRDVAGVLSVLLSLKKRPDIRFDANSESCKRLAYSVANKMKDETELFTFQTDPCLLLILDRRDDAATPLLTQWTYQAMVHELLGIHNNRIDMSQAGAMRDSKDIKELVLNSEQDAFFRHNMFSTYYDVATRVQKLVAEYQATTKSNTKLETIEDMQRFVENFPQFKAIAGNATKHMALMAEISRTVSSRQLMEVSKIEQDIVCGNEHDSVVQQLQQLLQMRNIQFDDKLRVVMLYALRYEKDPNSQLNQFTMMLQQMATSPTQAAKISTVDKLLAYAGVGVRKNDLFHQSLGLKNIVRTVASGLKGVENVFTQHKPYVYDLLNALFSGDLRPQTFPFVDNAGNPKARYKKVIVFISGGATFEELVAIDALIKNPKYIRDGFRVLLGGSCIHNSASFLHEIDPESFPTSSGTGTNTASGITTGPTPTYPSPPPTQSAPSAMPVNQSGPGSRGGSHTGSRQNTMTRAEQQAYGAALK